LTISFTGHNGDVGSILFKKLEVLGASCSVFNGEKKNIDILLHIAAKSPPATNDEIINSNIIYLQRVINDAKNIGVKSIIFFSTVSLYGVQNKEWLCENDCINNPSFYGLSKLFGEKYFSECGINTLSLRLPAVLGYRNKTNFLSRIYEKCKQNEEIEINNADKIFNNFISVDSIADLVLNVNIKSGFDAINLASQRELTVKDISDTIVHELNSKSKISIRGNQTNFFNISTKKAELEYGFKPTKAKDTIANWIKERKIYEQS